MDCLLSSAGKSDGNPEYIAFILVPFFFLLGLLGVLICHILKRKGYRCTTESEDDEELEKEEDEEDKDPEKGGECFVEIQLILHTCFLKWLKEVELPLKQMTPDQSVPVIFVMGNEIAGRSL